MTTLDKSKLAKETNMKMNDKIVECLKNIETHADVLMKIPASEQFIGNIQAVVSIALLDIKRCLEELAKESD